MNAYLNTAQGTVVNLMIAEQAVKSAKTQFDCEISEIRYAEELKEANAMLTRWQDDAFKMARQIKSLDNDLNEVIGKMESIKTKDTRPSFVEAALNPEYGKLLKVAEALKESRDALRKSKVSLYEAIDYLKEYLYPSQEGENTNDEDLPFESTALRGFSTPLEAAEILVNDILNAHGYEIFQEYADRKADPRTENITDACIYDMLFQVGEEEFEKYAFGAEYLETYIDTPEFTTTRTLFETEMCEQGDGNEDENSVS